MLRHLIFTLALLLIPALGGCNILLQGAKLPHADGTWVGRIVPVKVQTNKGELLEAAALQIESGPDLPFGVPADLGAGKSPLLVRFQDETATIIEPKQLPLGQRVRIKGCSVMKSANRPRAPLDSQESVERPRDPAVKPWEHAEHVLIVYGQPKLLEK